MGAFELEATETARLRTGGSSPLGENEILAWSSSSVSSMTANCFRTTSAAGDRRGEGDCEDGMARVDCLPAPASWHPRAVFSGKTGRLRVLDMEAEVGSLLRLGDCRTRGEGDGVSKGLLKLAVFSTRIACFRSRLRGESNGAGALVTVPCCESGSTTADNVRFFPASWRSASGPSGGESEGTNGSHWRIAPQLIWTHHW